MMTGVKGSLLPRFSSTFFEDVSGRDFEERLQLAREVSFVVLREVGGNDAGGESRRVFDEWRAVAVEDEAAGGHRRRVAQAVGMGALLVGFALEDLHVQELEGEDAEDDEDEQAEVEELVVQVLLFGALFLFFRRAPASLLWSENVHIALVRGD